MRRLHLAQVGSPRGAGDAGVERLQFSPMSRPLKAGAGPGRPAIIRRASALHFRADEGSIRQRQYRVEDGVRNGLDEVAAPPAGSGP